MLYLYLDESGDLGFDFVNKKPSEFFTICVLAIKGSENDRALVKSVRGVLRRGHFLRADKAGSELKGYTTPQELKKFFYKKASRTDFKLYSVTLNKKKAYPLLAEDKDRIYNYIARLALEHINSHESPGLQAVDMFAWGIFRKYEKADLEWFNVFKARVCLDRLYLP